MRTYSIIIVSLNNASGLSGTLDSIRALKYTGREVILVDGGSTNSTKTIIEKNRDILSHVISEKDNGIYDAMNKGIKHASGEYIVFMNAGDCFASPETLSLVNDHNEDIILGGTIYGHSVRIPPGKMTLYDILSIGINHQSTYYRADILRKYGFDENYTITADLKSVIEPMARDKASVRPIPHILSVCEGGGLSKKKWKEAIIEKRRLVEEVIDPFYRDDYVRFADIDNSMLNYFILLSHFKSVFPIIRCLAAITRFLNKQFKHIPVR